MLAGGKLGHNIHLPARKEPDSWTNQQNKPSVHAVTSPPPHTHSASVSPFAKLGISMLIQICSAL